MMYDQEQEQWQDDGNYGLVTNLPSGKVYVMRFHDGAISGPYYHDEHRAALMNASLLDYQPDFTKWEEGDQWIMHDLLNTCPGCNN